MDPGDVRGCWSTSWEEAANVGRELFLELVEALIPLGASGGADLEPVVSEGWPATASHLT